MAFTFFFRDLPSLELAIDHLLPIVSGRTRVRIWDAGCAMGQEPYTLAILLSERMNPFAYRNLEIFATDYDLPLLQVVEKATYAREELSRIPEGFLDRYFTPCGDGNYQVVDKVRTVLKTHHHDLLSLQPVRENFSLVVCKNVLLHFQPSERIEVIKMYHKALEPNGLLVMENTQKLPEELNSHFRPLAVDVQLYQKIEVPV